MLPRAASLEGKRVPHVTFKARIGGQWKDASTDALFKSRTVVVFSLSGAYTPDASSSQLARYDELAGAFAADGVDEVVCLSVNKAVVMEVATRDWQADNVTLLFDAAGDFTAGRSSLQNKMTAAQLLAMPFCHPVIEEGLRTAVHELVVKLRNVC